MGSVTGVKIVHIWAPTDGDLDYNYDLVQSVIDTFGRDDIFIRVQIDIDTFLPRFHIFAPKDIERDVEIMLKLKL